MKTVDYKATRELSHIPLVFKLEDPRHTPAGWFNEARQVPGSVVILPPWPIGLEGPIDKSNIAKITGYNPSRKGSVIVHRGDAPLFTGMKSNADLEIFPEFSDFRVERLEGPPVTFCEIGGQQNCEFNRVAFFGYDKGKYIRFVNLNPVPVPGLGFGTWTEQIRIWNCFSYGSPAIGVECINESLDGSQNSFINFYIDMHFSLTDPESCGMEFNHAQVTAGKFFAKFNLHAKATCMRLKNNSLLRNNRYDMLVEGEGCRVEIDGSSVLEGRGAFIKDHPACVDRIAVGAQVINSDAVVNPSLLRLGFQV